jgi:molecular chaperone HscB
VPCWACQAAEEGSGDRCGTCGALQPAPPGEDLFAALGVSRRFAQDTAELERRFRDRARAFHPDRFARAQRRERRIALERSARLNEAHRVLRAARSRAGYLLALLGGPRPEGVSLVPAFLAEQLEVRERIGGALAARDEAEMRRIEATLAGQLGAVDARLAELFADEAPAPEALAMAARLLAEARLLERALEAVRGVPAS